MSDLRPPRPRPDRRATPIAAPDAAATRGQDDRALPESHGATAPMARLLTAPGIEEEIQALAATAPAMTEDQRATLARLVGLDRTRHAQRTGRAG